MNQQAEIRLFGFECVVPSYQCHSYIPIDPVHPPTIDDVLVSLSLNVCHNLIDNDTIYCTRNGVLVQNKQTDRIHKDDVLEVRIRLKGGKGGFGSLLKGKKQKNKVDNVDACRDLHGNRIGDVRRQTESANIERTEGDDTLDDEEKKNEAGNGESAVPAFSHQQIQSETAKRSLTEKIEPEKLDQIGNRLDQAVRRGLEAKRKLDHVGPIDAKKPKSNLSIPKQQQRSNMWANDEDGDSDDNDDDSGTKDAN